LDGGVAATGGATAGAGAVAPLGAVDNETGGAAPEPGTAGAGVWGKAAPRSTADPEPLRANGFSRLALRIQSVPG
jgi:hypothetical protein